MADNEQRILIALNDCSSKISSTHSTDARLSVGIDLMFHRRPAPIHYSAGQVAIVPHAARTVHHTPYVAHPLVWHSATPTPVLFFENSRSVFYVHTFSTKIISSIINTFFFSDYLPLAACKVSLRGDRYRIDHWRFVQLQPLYAYICND